MKYVFKILNSLSAGIGAFVLMSCAAMLRPSEPTLNEKLLKTQRAQMKAGQDPQAEVVSGPTSDFVQSSLWAKSLGSPYLIRNQKAQKVGDLLTIIVNENTNATTSANTAAKHDGTLTLSGTLGLGQGTNPQIGGITAGTQDTSDFKGNGKTDRSNQLTSMVQATVENVLPNGVLFIRGRKAVTINKEDEEIEVTGFVRPDDIRINNTVISTMIADAEIRLVGTGVLSDKQSTGWGIRLLDWIWPW